MHLTSDQTLKVTLASQTYPHPSSNPQLSPSQDPQKLQPVDPAGQQREPNPHTHLLYSCFRNLACVGQVGSAIIALTFAIELASSLTVVMIILGCLWISCEHFGEVDS